MTCWRRKDGRSEGSAGVSVGSGGLISEEGGGEEPKMSSRELSTVVVVGDWDWWGLSCMAAVVSEWVEVMVVEGERGAEGVELGESIGLRYSL